MNTLKKHDIEYTGAYLEFHKFLATAKWAKIWLLLDFENLILLTSDHSSGTKNLITLPVVTFTYLAELVLNFIKFKTLYNKTEILCILSGEKQLKSPYNKTT